MNEMELLTQLRAEVPPAVSARAEERFLAGVRAPRRARHPLQRAGRTPLGACLAPHWSPRAVRMCQVLAVQADVSGVPACEFRNQRSPGRSAIPVRLPHLRFR